MLLEYPFCLDLGHLASNNFVCQLVMSLCFYWLITGSFCMPTVKDCCCRHSTVTGCTTFNILLFVMLLPSFFLATDKRNV